MMTVLDRALSHYENFLRQMVTELDCRKDTASAVKITLEVEKVTELKDIFDGCYCVVAKGVGEASK